MKRFVSLFCMLMLVALPFAWAETEVEFLSQQAVPAPASLPDLQLQPLDMQPYENQANTLFPAAEDAQYMVGNRSDEKSYHFFLSPLSRYAGGRGLLRHLSRF